MTSREQALQNGRSQSAKFPDAPFRTGLAIRGGCFSVAELRLPGHRPAIIELTNNDTVARAFRSADLGIDTVLAGGERCLVRLHPLTPGRYAFHGDAPTACGLLIATGEIATAQGD